MSSESEVPASSSRSPFPVSVADDRSTWSQESNSSVNFVPMPVDRRLDPADGRTYSYIQFYHSKSSADGFSKEQIDRYWTETCQLVPKLFSLDQDLTLDDGFSSASTSVP